MYLTSWLLFIALAFAAFVPVSAAPGEKDEENAEEEAEEDDEEPTEEEAKQKKPLTPRRILAVVKKCTAEDCSVRVTAGGKGSWTVVPSGSVHVFEPAKLSDIVSGENVWILAKPDSYRLESGGVANVYMQIQVIVVGGPFEPPPLTEKQEALRLTWETGPAYRSKANQPTTVNGRELQMGPQAEIVRLRNGGRADVKANAMLYVRGLLDENEKPPSLRAITFAVLHPTVVQKYAEMLFGPVTAPAKK